MALLIIILIVIFQIIISIRNLQKFNIDIKFKFLLIFISSIPIIGLIILLIYNFIKDRKKSIKDFICPYDQYHDCKFIHCKYFKNGNCK